CGNEHRRRSCNTVERGGMKVMGLRAHSMQETSPRERTPVCDLGAALPRPPPTPQHQAKHHQPQQTTGTTGTTRTTGTTGTTGNHRKPDLPGSPKGSSSIAGRSNGVARLEPG